MVDATPLLKTFAKYRYRRLCSLQPAEVQRQQLLKLVRSAQHTCFGKDHDFSRIKSVRDYQSRVPLRRYEEFWQQYWQPTFPTLQDLTWPGHIPFFALSSGTSAGTTKYIPISREMIASNRKAGLDLLTFHVINRPSSRIFAGRSFVLGGSTDLVQQSARVWSGDLSGIAVKTLPLWAKLRYFPPQRLALIKNWEEKIEVLARESLRRRITMLSGVPTWILLFFSKLQELTHSRRVVDFYPHLEMLVHGGVNFAPYVQQFRSLLEGSHAELREVYPASEGFVAVADRGYQEGLRVSLDHQLFYEFVPLEELDRPSPTRHWIADIETGVNYAIVLTTCAGLWSYVLGDTVRFIDRDTPRLLITGRTSYYLSAFGEHVIAEELEDATSFAASSLGIDVVDYSVGALFPQSTNELGGHLFVVEFSPWPSNGGTIEEFSKLVDQRLRQRNEDYDAHRADGFGLNPPRILAARPGTFVAWMKARGKLGGQNKVPRILTDQDTFKDLQHFAAHFRG
ncbi:MAG: GH3 auxin-responsive promoter family protein [Bdellovibrionota bacterium]|nr:MAG: GH3 auxin-responsive promoter family protein [Bdellovibrionota bacterium]